jgi:hypothetical protein
MTDKVELTRTQGVILYHLAQHPLGTGELLQILRKKANVNDDETILINCKQLVEKGLIYDKPTKKGKYRIVTSKIPVFLEFRACNRSLKSKILNDIFPSTKNNKNIKSIDDFSRTIGIYISYVLLEATRPDGPWTVNWIKTSNDPRMQDIDLLRETWLDDMIDQEHFFEYFLLLKSNTDYQELVKRFESSFPDIYNKIRFHEGIAEVRRLKKQQNKKPLSTTSNEELEDYDPVGLEDYFDKKNKIKSDID